ncbi:MAG: 30S ribosomal protein S13, partial [Desulfurococcaceae archaeon]
YVNEDIEHEKRIKTWRGVRHAIGLKVRGQRTRTTGRAGITVGVKRKRAAPQQQQK